MRVVLIASLLSANALPCLAQPPGSDASVRVPSAEVRGGRSSIFPLTGTLRFGQPLRVLREEGDWLAVTPPEGSSSWVMERVLDQPPTPGRRTICVVLADDAPVLLGSADSATPHPNVVAHLKRGTMVVVTGEKAASEALGDKAIWWRIGPSPSEVRWISKDAVTPVEASKPNATTAAKLPPAGRPVPDLWRRAEQFERAGNAAQAVVSYRQLAAEQSGPGGDHDLAMRAVSRADLLSRSVAPASTSARNPAQSPTAAGPWQEGVLMRSGPGTLRRAAFQIDGRSAFVLEDTRGYPRMYVAAQPGLHLDPFVNRSVELFGPMVNRPELTIRGYMSVGTVYLLK